jgi:hypothetical protein
MTTRAGRGRCQGRREAQVDVPAPQTAAVLIVAYPLVPCPAAHHRWSHLS